MSLSLKQIRYFVAAAETGRVSQAAMELNVSQSTVTAAIQQLESAVGARLLERVSTGVTMTMEGSRFLSQGRQILAAVDEAVRCTHVAAEPLRGVVRIGVTYTVSGYFLPRHQMRFHASFPGVRIELFEAPRDVVERALLDGEINLAIMLVSNLKSSDVLASEILLRSPRRLWLAHNHPLTRNDRIDLASIAKYPYVLLTVDDAHETTLRYWNASFLEPKTIFQTSSMEAVRAMVGGCMGVTILSDLIYRPWSLEGHRIVTRTIEEDVPSLDIGIVWRRGGELSSAANAFRDFMRFAVGLG